jgi:hypothetical protein
VGGFARAVREAGGALGSIGAAIVLLGFALVTTGCGAAGFDGTTYHGEGFAFRVPAPPASWQRLEVSHASLAFRDESDDATIAVNGRCNVDGEDVPLSALTQHLFLQFTDRAIVAQEVVPFDGREALHSVLVAKLDGVPKKFDVWVLKKDGCVYDFFYIAMPERYESGLPAFQQFVQGFRSLGPHGG